MVRVRGHPAVSPLPSRSFSAIGRIILALPVLFFAGAPCFAEDAYRLVGTIESRAFTGAVFLGADGQQTFHRLGDALPDGSKIVKVRNDSIALKGPDGSLFDLYVASGSRLPTASAAPPDSPAYTAPQTPPPAPAGDPRSRPARHRSRAASSSEE